MRIKAIAALSVLSLLLVFSSNAGADFVINQSQFTESLVAGDNVTEDIVFKYTTSNTNTINFYIETNVTPDPIGINVTYTNVPIVIRPNIEYTIHMFVNTSMLLVPGQYIVLTTLRAEQASLPPASHHHGSRVVAVITPPPTNNTPPPITPPPVTPPHENYTNITVPITPPESTIPWIYIAVFFVSLAFILLLSFLAYKEKKKKKET